MTKIVKSVGVLIALCVVAAITFVFSGDGEIRSCQKLKPGITDKDLENHFGAAHDTYEKGGQTWKSFKSTMAAADLIRARLSEKNGEVVELRCRGIEGPATWQKE